MEIAFQLHLAAGTRRERQACAAIDAAVVDDTQARGYEAHAAAAFRAAGRDFDATQAVFRRYLALEDDGGEIVGYAQFYQTPWAFDPTRFHMTVRVHPDYRGAGVGSTLYTQIIADLIALGARTVRAEVAESVAESAFLAHHGWHELFRAWRCALNPERFDLAPFAERAATLEAQGMTITTLSDVSQHGTGWLPRLHALDNTLRAEANGEGAILLPLERFALLAAGNAESLPEAFGIACDGEEYVGESCLQRGSEPDALELRFVGVLPQYRRRGIATTLLLRAIAYADVQGYGRITAWSESSQPALVALHERFGFAREAGTVWYEKTLT